MRLGARGFCNQLMTSFQSMAEISVAKRDHKLKASYVKGGTRVGVGRLIQLAQRVYMGINHIARSTGLVYKLWHHFTFGSQA